MSQRILALWLALAVVFAVPRISAAQAPVTNPPPPPGFARFYVDVNLLGYADPLGEAKTFENYALKFGEVATFKASYPEPSSSRPYPAYVGGGYMLGRYVGIGLGYNRMSRNSVVDLSAQVAHPTFFNAMATGTGNTELSRKESAVHVSLTIAPFRSSRMEVRVMGGPSFFTLKGDMVQSVEYAQFFNASAPENAITLTGNSSREVTASALGFHVGADFTCYLTRFAGIVGGIRYGSATVTVETEPLSNLTQEFLVGSTTTFLGLRFRFGPTQQNK
jgi:hypothetical protein